MQIRHQETFEALVGNWSPFEIGALDTAPALPVETPVRKGTMPPHRIEKVLRSETGYYIAIGKLPDPSEALPDVTDTLFLAEFVRQAIETIARTMLGMVAEDVFVLKAVDVKRSDSIAGPVNETRTEAVIVLPEKGVRWRADGSAYAVDGPVYCYLGAQSGALFGGTVAFLKPGDYAALRGVGGSFGFPKGHTEPLFPSCVGKMRQADVLIGQVRRHRDGLSARIVPQNPQAYFDRALDHYPGMMMAEAARQLAVYSTCLDRDVLPGQVRVTLIRMGFSSFAELATPPFLHATVKRTRQGGQTIIVEVRQSRNVRARFEIATTFVTNHGGLK